MSHLLCYTLEVWTLPKDTIPARGLLGACHNSAADLDLLLKSPLRCHRSLAVIFLDSHNMAVTNVILSTFLFLFSRAFANSYTNSK